MLKRFFLLAFGLFLFIAAPASAEIRGGYLSVIEDLPMMPGMAEVADSAVVFDKAGGRIVEVAASTAATIPEVRMFYIDTLPQIGWHQRNDAIFTRDNEMLKLAFEQKEGRTIVHYTLTPHSEGK